MAELRLARECQGFGAEERLRLSTAMSRPLGQADRMLRAVERRAASILLLPAARRRRPALCRNPPRPNRTARGEVAAASVPLAERTVDLYFQQAFLSGAVPVPSYPWSATTSAPALGQPRQGAGSLIAAYISLATHYFRFLKSLVGVSFMGSNPGKGCRHTKRCSCQQYS
jgi:hypothetical protein